MPLSRGAVSHHSPSSSFSEPLSRARKVLRCSRRSAHGSMSRASGPFRISSTGFPRSATMRAGTMGTSSGGGAPAAAKMAVRLSVWSGWMSKATRSGWSPAVLGRIVSSRFVCTVQLAAMR